MISIKKSLFLLLTFLIGINICNAQIGGNGTYEFLNLVSSARAVGVGGSGIAINDNDFNLVLQNPSLLNSSMDKNLSLNYVNYFSGINYGFASYAKSYDKNRTFYVGIQFVNYGSFTNALETGEKIGEFSAGEYAFYLGYSKKIDSMFTFGAQVKPIYSSLYTYNSFGLGIDLGINYLAPAKLFSASIVARNIGTEITTYTNTTRQRLPMNIQAGFSSRFPHAPLRITVVLDHLETPDLTYINYSKPITTITDTSSIISYKTTKSIPDQIMRHIIIGAELIPSPNFTLRIGYNYQRRQELLLDTKKGLTGLSFGAGIKIAKYNFNFAYSLYNIAGGTLVFSLNTNLGNFGYKKSELKENN